MLTEPKGRVRYLSNVELAAVLEASREHSAVMHAAVLISLGCGERQGELRRSKWSDVDLEKQQLPRPSRVFEAAWDSVRAAAPRSREKVPANPLQVSPK